MKVKLAALVVTLALGLLRRSGTLAQSIVIWHTIMFAELVR